MGKVLFRVLLHNLLLIFSAITSFGDLTLAAGVIDNEDVDRRKLSAENPEMGRPVLHLVSSSRLEYAYDGEEIACYCKQLAPRETSWSDANPGRIFYGCQNFKVGGCGFFRWYDMAMCNRAKQLLRKFRDNERKLANENLALRNQIYALHGDDETHGHSGYSMKRKEFESVEYGSVQSNNQVEEKNEQVMKLRMELESLKDRNRMLKHNANRNKKEKEMYMFLLFWSWCSIICILIRLYMGYDKPAFAALPY